MQMKASSFLIKTKFSIIFDIVSNLKYYTIF